MPLLFTEQYMNFLTQCPARIVKLKPGDGEEWSCNSRWEAHTKKSH